MYPEIIVIVAALLGSILSFFCGFGLGTTLLPAFMLFFPAPVAIAAGAVVHMLNNLFKLYLTGRHADWSIIKSFGLMSVVGALVGALSLAFVSNISPLTTFTFCGKMFNVTVLQITVAVVIISFSILEFLPSMQVIQLPKKFLPFGGLISGYFGGLSGHQGALRSAFLMKVGLSKEAFIGTRVVCACLVDVTRISVYSGQISAGWDQLEIGLLAAATLAAFVGAYIGNKLMKKTSFRAINIIVAISLVLFGLAYGIFGTPA